MKFLVNYFNFNFNYRVLSLSLSCHFNCKYKQLLLPLPWTWTKTSRLSSSYQYYSTSSNSAIKMVVEDGDGVKDYGDIAKSPNDHRQYRGIELNNKLKAVLVSDPNTDKSAASLSVAIGSMSEPLILPGLAHFCEHMLFMGTEKYPIENSFDKYLAANGGGSNAYTTYDYTNYFFDVGPNSLSEALDRFANFFISPLFNESSTEREVNAVNSEDDKNLTTDTRRINMVEESLSNPNHPYSHFKSGNLVSLWTRPKELNIDVRQALLNFHRDLYSSNLMCVSVIGKESLDELQTMVVNLFSAIKNKNVEMPFWYENPMRPEDLQVRIEVEPIKDIRMMTLGFPIPDTTKEYKSGCTDYISHLLGHEGEGSLFSFLKSKNWIKTLGSYDTTPARGFAFFRIKSTLTTEGLDHINEIIEHTFQYIKVMKREGVQKWIWEESRDLNMLAFRFQDKKEPESLVTGLAADMQIYPMGDVLVAEQGLYSEFRPERIDEILGLMTPGNCRYTVVSKNFEGHTKHVEEWHQVKYNVDPIDSSIIEKWKNCVPPAELQLPKPNEFIATEFDLKPRDVEIGIIPRVIEDTSLSRVWFLQDNEFKLPKAIVWMEIFSPLPLLSPLYSNLNALLTECLKDNLAEFSYPALLASLEYTLSASIYGQEIKVKGYNHKLPVLLNKILEKLSSFSVSQARFETLKDHYVRGLKNWKDEQPYSHATYYMTYILREKRWSVDDLLEAADSTTLDKLEDYAKNFCSNLKFEFLLYGNLTEEESLKISSDSLEVFRKNNDVQPLLSSQVTKMREVNLPEGCKAVFRTDHQSHVSSCSAVLFQIGLENLRENAVLDLLHKIMAEPCYNVLRTLETLGYIVSCSVRRDHKTQGLRVLVQSDRHPGYVESRIDNFLTIIEETLRTMTGEEFTEHKDSLIVELSEKPKKISKRGALLWAEITGQDYNFNRHQIEIEQVEKLTLKDVIEFFNEYIAKDGSKKKRLNVQVVSKARGEFPKEDEPFQNVNLAEHQLIENVQAWKQQQSLYPRPPSDFPIKTSTDTKDK